MLFTDAVLLNSKNPVDTIYDMPQPIIDRCLALGLPHDMAENKEGERVVTLGRGQKRCNFKFSILPANKWTATKDEGYHVCIPFVWVDTCGEKFDDNDPCVYNLCRRDYLDVLAEGLF